MKGFSFFFLLLFSVAAFAQNSVNNYKYVLVPEKFSFQKEAHQYGLNTTTQMVLNGMGFEALIDDKELPTDLAGNKCNALIADVEQRKAVFVTNLTLTLKDCRGNVLFKSKEGKSREKDYGAAYNEALRDALSSLTTLNYAYNGTVQPSAAPAAAPVATAPAATTSAATVTTASSTTTPVATEPAATVPVAAATAETKSNGLTLYAQPTETGYQLIDTTPKKVLSLYKTTVAEYFIADNGTDKGILFKRNGDWQFEYYKNGKLVSEKMQIKF
ncbi:hypothetical protein SAMN05444266_1086 [Chitinophaga jiangningensis]|uniref:Secreted protein n=1 Tax=Chitinophaga jiangningensis TaxID=1419482 RepID=A0A1M7IKW5_9BACT|nr:hypothetical protein [Chitinophaga jiangningensis]SHM41360.1 hypothetical protein SAMN05444266_1086 [Chitinophaga jiangningensis]